MKHERCANLWGEQIERLLKILQALLCIDFEHRIGVGRGERRLQHSCEIDQRRNLRLPKGVLLEDVLLLSEGAGEIRNADSRKAPIVFTGSLPI